MRIVMSTDRHVLRRRLNRVLDHRNIALGATN
jgi:hypothetical protein